LSLPIIQIVTANYTNCHCQLYNLSLPIIQFVTVNYTNCHCQLYNLSLPIIQIVTANYTICHCQLYNLSLPIIQIVTANSDTVYSLSQRRRTQKYCFAGPEVRVSLEHNTGRRENKAFFNLTLEEEVMLLLYSCL